MKYNLLFQTSLGGFNLMDLDETKLPIVLDYYENGKEKFTISGKSYSGKKLYNFKIYTFEKDVDLDSFEKYCMQNQLIERNIGGFYFSERALALLGIDKTDDFIGDNPYGYKIQAMNRNKTNVVFVNAKRIDELRDLSGGKFDFSKLIRLCEEINDAFSNGNYLSVGMLGRTIIHHIPPVFNFLNFDEVANNYGGPRENKSFKKNMKHLNESLKNIADGFLHNQIRERESLPNDVQVDFRQDLDLLLGEIVRVSK